MPNHVTNRVVLVGTESDIKELVEKLKEGDNPFDFSKIIPFPEELKKTTSPTKVVSQKEYDEAMRMNAEIKDPNSYDFRHPITKKMQKDFIKRFGCDNWYDWKCANWGTKWGSYDVTVSEITPDGAGMSTVTFNFSTAWATPIPIFERLTNMFPNVIIRLTFADENTGYNTGKVEWFAGQEIEVYQPEGGSKEAHDLYFELHEGAIDDFELINGNYVYKEEE